jgi:phage repressor protein C with HTH and peptisase S24 domain
MQDIQNKGISQRTKILIDKLLLGRFTLVEIAKVTGISEQWLRTYLNPNSNLEPPTSAS